MSLIRLQNASLAFGSPPVLVQATASIEPGDKIALIGRNGAGKSTLFRVLLQRQSLDDGELVIANSKRIAVLEQDPPQRQEQSIFDFVSGGLGQESDVLKAYHSALDAVEADPSERNLVKLQEAQTRVDNANAWHLDSRVEKTLEQLNLNGDLILRDLSGGQRRKAALARVLVTEPDILLLDEPTNHLDIDMVIWLESVLKRFSGALLLVSHDRAFVRNTVNKIWDLDRGQLTVYEAAYDRYLELKQLDLEAEEAHHRQFDKKLAAEEVWVRQGIKARRTRNEGRVRALKAMREEYKARINTQAKGAIGVNQSNPSGKRVFECRQLTYRASEHVNIVEGFDCFIRRGDKVALIGPNGCGKTTLIKLLLEEISPQSGTVIKGVNLALAYFDQERMNLNLERPVIEEVADGKMEFMYNGQSRHVMGYLQEYLFAPDRVRAPVSSLSGGEKNRLLLAKLMTQPNNILVLDEPTNDLDVETLELLESKLVDYQGTVILVSHDREFIDNVATSSFVFLGNGRIEKLVGGYQSTREWMQQQGEQWHVGAVHRDQTQIGKKPETTEQPTGSIAQDRVADQTLGSSGAPVASKKKVSYKLQRELEELPEQIARLEAEIERLQDLISDPDFYQNPPDGTAAVFEHLKQAQTRLEQKYQRWDELETLANS